MNHPELMSSFTTFLDPFVVLRFEQVLKSRTIPTVLSSVVQGGSEKTNHSKLMSSFITALDPCVVLWFEQVRKSQTIPNL